MPIRQASRILSSKNISETAKLKDVRSINTVRINSRKFSDAIGDKMNTMRIFPATVTVIYTANSHEASILSFCSMLYPIANAVASTAVKKQIVKTIK
jgi:hypothetical protein